MKKTWWFCIISSLVLIGMIGHETIPHHHHHNNNQQVENSCCHNHNNKNESSDSNPTCSFFEFIPLGYTKFIIVNVLKAINYQLVSFVTPNTQQITFFKTWCFFEHKPLFANKFKLLYSNTFSHRGPPFH